MIRSASITLAILSAALSTGCRATNHRHTHQGAATPRPAPSGTPALASPGHALLAEAIGVISREPLGRERTDWPLLHQSLAAQLPPSAAAHDAHAAIRTAVAALQDPHARFDPPPPPPAPTPPPPAQHAADEPSPASQPAPKQPAIPTVPECRPLADGARYILIPGVADPAIFDAYARALFACCAESNQRTLIDLRLNGGGNLWPMLLGLHPLLGDGPALTSITPGGHTATFGTSAASSWINWGSGPEPQFRWTDPPPQSAPPSPPRIAVLIGPWTMSSGEALAIALAARPNVRLFGEPTAGLTTVTNQYRLTDGSLLTLPVSRMGSPDGIPVTGPISPHETAEWNGWPGPDDAAAARARAWLLSP